MAATKRPRRRNCAHMVVHELLAETDPGYRGRRLAVEDETRRSIASGQAMRVARKLLTIEVVVHVVHRTDAENISDAQVRSQIAALNRDYTRKNADKSKVPAPYKSLIGNPNIRFKLATKAPDGKRTTGITRTATTVRGFGADDAVKRKRSGGKDPWPTDRYLNLWTCTLSGGLLGYAQFPGGPAKTDGVVILHTAFGTQGTAAAPFNKGRTATHEVGHYLNLRHIWGDRNDCSGNDFVADTPAAQAANFGKPKYPHVTCHNGPNGDMFMNYMDYVDDAAMVMFSEGQVARMNAALAGPRKKLVGLR
jgi:pregnancy-associated plasma protein-A